MKLHPSYIADLQTLTPLDNLWLKSSVSMFLDTACTLPVDNPCSLEVITLSDIRFKDNPTLTIMDGSGNELYVTQPILVDDSYGTTAPTPTAPNWNEIVGTPSTFAPTAHNQPWSTITTTPTTLIGYGITDAFTQILADARYLKLSGGTLTGEVTFNSGANFAAGRLNLSKKGTIGVDRRTHGFGFGDAYTGIVSFYGVEANAINALGNAGAGASDGPFVYGYRGVSLGYSSVGVNNENLVAALKTDMLNVYVGGSISEAGTLLSAKYAPIAHTQLASTITDFATAADARITAQKGAALGVVPLDSGAKISTTYLPASIVGQVHYNSTWNASTNTPALPSASTDKGGYYIVSVAGIYNSIDFNVGDWVISDGTNWGKVDNTDSISSWNGRTGAILPIKADYSTWFADLSGAYADPAWITSLAWSKITSKPTTLAGYGITDALASSYVPTWASISGKPTTFAPSAHTHAQSEITGLETRLTAIDNNWANYATAGHAHTFASLTSKPTTLAGYGITDAVSSSDSRLTDTRTPTNQAWYVYGDNATGTRSITDFNAVLKSGFGSGASATGAPTTGWYHIITNKYAGDTTGWLFQIAAGFGSTASPAAAEGYYVRIKEGTSAPTAWRKLWHDGNLTGDQGTTHTHSQYLTSASSLAWSAITGKPTAISNFTDGSWPSLGASYGWGYSGAANAQFGFYASNGVVDVYADGNFYATDNKYPVWHSGTFNPSSYLPLVAGSGNKLTGTLYGTNLVMSTGTTAPTVGIYEWPTVSATRTFIGLTSQDGTTGSWSGTTGLVLWADNAVLSGVASGGITIGGVGVISCTSSLVTLGAAISGSTATFSGTISASNFVSNNFVQGDNLTRSTRVTSLDSISKSGFYDGSIATGSPSGSWDHIIHREHVDNNGFSLQIQCDYFGDNFRFRRRIAGTWQGWIAVWHNGNFDPATKSNVGHTHDYVDRVNAQTIYGEKIYGDKAWFAPGTDKAHLISQCNIVTAGWQSIELYRSHDATAVNRRLSYGYHMSDKGYIQRVEANASYANDIKYNLVFGSGARVKDGYNTETTLMTVDNAGNTTITGTLTVGGSTVWTASNFSKTNPSFTGSVYTTDYLQSGNYVLASSAYMGMWTLNATYAFFGKNGANNSTWTTTCGYATDGVVNWISATSATCFAIGENTTALTINGVDTYTSNALYSTNTWVGSCVGPNDSVGGASRLGVVSANKQNGWLISYGASGDMQLWDSTANNWTLRYRFTQLAMKMPIYAVAGSSGTTIAAPLYDGEVRLYRGATGQGACYLKCRASTEIVRYRTDAGAKVDLATAATNVPVDIQGTVVMLIWAMNGASEGRWTMLS